MKKYLWLTLSMLACDPMTPSASGVVTIGPNINITQYSTLHIRAFPSPTFTLSLPDLQTAEALPPLIVSALSEIAFPYKYEPVGVMGISDEAKYELFAWLSKETNSPELKGPFSGDAYGQTTFQAKKCGSFSKSYCGVTGGTDILIDKIAP